MQQNTIISQNNTAKDVRVVLFDLDGTLLDSQDFLVKTSYEVIERYYPGKYTIETVSKDFGNGFSRLLSDKVSEQSKRAIVEYREKKLKHYHQIPLFPGVSEGLHSLKKNEFRLGIVTNQSEMFSKNALKGNNVLELFDTVVSSGDVNEGKPSPEGIFKAMQQLGCEKNETIMIGDSRYDIMAGHRAGVLSGFLKWHNETMIPEEAPPDFIYENFEMLLSALIQTKKQ